MNIEALLNTMRKADQPVGVDFRNAIAYQTKISLTIAYGMRSRLLQSLFAIPLTLVLSGCWSGQHHSGNQGDQDSAEHQFCQPYLTSRQGGFYAADSPSQPLAVDATLAGQPTTTANYLSMPKAHPQRSYNRYTMISWPCSRIILPPLPFGADPDVIYAYISPSTTPDGSAITAINNFIDGQKVNRVVQLCYTGDVTEAAFDSFGQQIAGANYTDVFADPVGGQATTIYQTIMAKLADKITHFSFEGLTDITNFPISPLAGITDASYLFKGVQKFPSDRIEFKDFTAISDATEMFANTKIAFNFGFADFTLATDKDGNTAKATGMFKQAFFEFIPSTHVSEMNLENVLLSHRGMGSATVDGRNVQDMFAGVTTDVPEFLTIEISQIAVGTTTAGDVSGAPESTATLAEVMQAAGKTEADMQTIFGDVIRVTSTP